MKIIVHALPQQFRVRIDELGLVAYFNTIDEVTQFIQSVITNVTKY